MTALVLTSLLLPLLMDPAFALEPMSVHQAHAEQQPAPSFRYERELVPPDQVGEKRAWVYGYYAFWAGKVADLPWDKLTHVAIFSVELGSNGALTQTHRWTDIAEQALALAAPYDVKVHVAIACFDKAVLSAVLSDPSRRQLAVDQLVELVNKYGAHGVAVDFEGMPAANKSHLVEFVRALNERVDEVTVATPPIDHNGAYDYDELALNSDGLFIMGYDYHWKGGDPGPVSPLLGSSKWGPYGLEWSFNDHLQWGAKPTDIIMGLPLYGYSWPSTNTNIPGDGTGKGSSVLYADALLQAAQHGRSYDDDGVAPYYFPSGTQQTWYDDLESLDAKIAWSLDQGAKGIGFWAVNYEAGDPEFWDMVAMHTEEAPQGGDDDGGEATDGAGAGGGAGDGAEADTSTAPDSSNGGDDGDDGPHDDSLPPSLERGGDAAACSVAPHDGSPTAWLVLALLALATRRRNTTAHHSH